MTLCFPWALLMAQWGMRCDKFLRGGPCICKTFNRHYLNQYINSRNHSLGFRKLCVWGGGGWQPGGGGSRKGPASYGRGNIKKQSLGLVAA